MSDTKVETVHKSESAVRRLFHDTTASRFPRIASEDDADEAHSSSPGVQVRREGEEMNRPEESVAEDVALEIRRLPKMNGKPMFEIVVKEILNWRSAFGYKLLCDYLTFSLGSACAAMCSYCYVESIVTKHPEVVRLRRTLARLGLRFEDVVIVRIDALRILREQLTVKKPRSVDLREKRVIFTSTLVDPALNPALADQTLEACLIILENTNWDIRILSKGNFLRRIAQGLPEEFQHRVIFGHSTGLLDRVSKAVEKGTASLSRRLEDHYWLQANGFRTFAMLCPILPGDDVESDVRMMVDAVRIDRCEHVWAEAINLRGESMHRTRQALEVAGLHADAQRLLAASGKNSEPWEAYAREVFTACKAHIPAEKLRFLQYTNPKTVEYWASQRCHGAVLLGKVAESAGLASAHPYWTA